MGKFDNFNIPIFSLYKPFRNQLRTYNLFESLYLIWSYSRNFTFNYPFPIDVELPTKFDPNSDLLLRRYYSLPEFELEFLLKESIINCHCELSESSLKQIVNLSSIINYLRFTIRDGIDKYYSSSTDIFVEYNRSIHNQFRWQNGVRPETVLRYYKIFTEEGMHQIIKNKFNLSPHDLFITGFYVFVTTGRNFRTPLPIKPDFNSITDEMFEVFFNHFSITLEQAKKELKECQQMNENFLYSYNPLIARPILLHQNSVLCPIPLMIYWQITSGLYYLIKDENGFSNAFGESFQKYIGEIINKSGKGVNYKVLAEEKYGKEEKRTVDWIIEDQSCVLFIECKAKRMTMISKSELDIKLGLEADLKMMAKFITQIYKTYIDFTSDKYPQIKYDGSKYFVPLVVTLEDWNLRTNLILTQLLREYVIENFKKIDLDASLIDTFPYHMRSTEEFERDIQIIYSLGLKEYFEKVNKNELLSYSESFKCKNPFEGEFEKIFVGPLKNHSIPNSV